MFKRLLFASFVMLLSLGFIQAEDIKGNIIKIDDKGVTVTADKKDKTGKTYTFAKDVKFYKMIKKTKSEIPDGVKADDFKGIPAKRGLAATVVINEKSEVTEVVLGKKKKGT